MSLIIISSSVISFKARYIKEFIIATLLELVHFFNPYPRTFFSLLSDRE